MMLKKFVKIFGGDPNQREIDRSSGLVDQINPLESQFEKLSDEQLKDKTNEFRLHLAKGESLDEILPEALLVVGMWRVSVPYWQISRVGVAGILAEQFLLLGTTLPGGGPMATILNVVVSGLLCVPLLYSVARRRDLIGREPLVSGLWWVAPVLVAAGGALLGRNWLFYPRGFISTAPFLLAYWVSLTREMGVVAWRLRAYAALLLVPFVINGLLVAIQHPSQPYFRGRQVLADVARDAEIDRKDYDVVLVHKWWMSQYYYYYLSEPQRVWPLAQRGARPRSATTSTSRRVRRRCGRARR